MRLHFFSVCLNSCINLHLRAKMQYFFSMRKLLLLFIMLLSTCAFSQTMDENTFFGKHPNFGRTELAFYGAFTKMSLSDMEDKKIVARLVKKYVKDYIEQDGGGDFPHPRPQKIKAQNPHQRGDRES